MTKNNSFASLPKSRWMTDAASRLAARSPSEAVLV